ncbi:hypothetical protein H4W28_002115 [Micrococcus yunnanensis]|nr:hypothetical protein [Micrococcus yunnanensis]
MAALRQPSGDPALSQRNLLPPPYGDDRNVWLAAGPCTGCVPDPVTRSDAHLVSDPAAARGCRGAAEMTARHRPVDPTPTSSYGEGSDQENRLPTALAESVGNPFTVTGCPR